MWNKKTEEQKEEKSGLAEGEAKGERSKQLEIAKNLIIKGFEKNEIAEITELSIEEIEKLAKEK